jgi:hypothetical protein
MAALTHGQPRTHATLLHFFQRRSSSRLEGGQRFVTVPRAGIREDDFERIEAVVRETEWGRWPASRNVNNGS